MSVESPTQKESRLWSRPLASEAPPAAPHVPIECLRSGREYVVEGRVERILVPGEGTGEPGRCRLGDSTASVWLVFPGVSRHPEVLIDGLVRAGGLVVTDKRGLAMIDPWVEPVVVARIG